MVVGGCVGITLLYQPLPYDIYWRHVHTFKMIFHGEESIMDTRQVTRAAHVRNRVCQWVELILKIIIILLIIFLGFIKSKPC